MYVPKAEEFRNTGLNRRVRRSPWDMKYIAIMEGPLLKMRMMR